MESTPYHSDGESEEDARMDPAHQKTHEISQQDEDGDHQLIDSTRQTQTPNPTDNAVHRNPSEPTRDVGQGLDKEKTDAEQAKRSPFAAFGGAAKSGEDDWGEFAEEDEEEQEAKESTPAQEDKEKQKYTFGATSGFGTKAWGASSTAASTASNKVWLLLSAKNLAANLHTSFPDSPYLAASRAAGPLLVRSQALALPPQSYRPLALLVNPPLRPPHLLSL